MYIVSMLPNVLIENIWVKSESSFIPVFCVLIDGFPYSKGDFNTCLPLRMSVTNRNISYLRLQSLPCCAYRHLNCLQLIYSFLNQVKSMAQYLDSIDKFYFPRSTRFPNQFKDDVRALISMATAEIIEKFNQVLLNLLRLHFKSTGNQIKQVYCCSTYYGYHWVT